MMTIRSMGTAVLGAAVLTGVTLSHAPARDCLNQFPWACNSVSTAAAAEPVAAPLKLTPKRAHRRKFRRKRKSRRHISRKAKPQQKRIAKPERDAPDDEPILTGRDTVSLVASLPWWRTPDTHAIQVSLDEIASPVLTAADALVPEPSVVVHTQLVEGVEIVSADVVNEIDLAAATNFAVSDPVDPNAFAARAEQQPAKQSWLQYLLATLGDALAAVSAARFLFA